MRMQKQVDEDGMPWGGDTIVAKGLGMQMEMFDEGPSKKEIQERQREETRQRNWTLLDMYGDRCEIYIPAWMRRSKGWKSPGDNRGLHGPYMGEIRRLTEKAVKLQPTNIPAMADWLPLAFIVVKVGVRP